MIYITFTLIAIWDCKQISKETNEKIIAEFLAKWVKEPHKILDKKEGCEINFNKAFTKKIEMRKSSDILAELSALDKEFGEI